MIHDIIQLIALLFALRVLGVLLLFVGTGFLWSIIFITRVICLYAISLKKK